MTIYAIINSMTKTHRTAIFWFIVALLALLTIGALKTRQNFLTRGIPDGLPEPITGGGAQLGINVYLEQYDDTALADNLDQIANSGMRTVKQSFYFDDDFDWTASDRLVTAVSSANLTLIPLLDGRPANKFAPINPDTFARWAGEFATRYGDHIQHYIIWDEPNLTSHWGGQPVNPIEYAALLTAAAKALRAADSDAAIIAAPLAPTVETGPLNLADHLYLQSLYEAGAANAFDIAAGKPYGFHTGPDDRVVNPNTLNFGRAILLREVMERNGDSGKALWAGNWGWNSLAPDWTGSPSLWGQTTAQQQADFTIAALKRAQQEWPWMGLMFLENWEPYAPEDDPHWGFSIKKRLETGDWRLTNLQSPVSNLQSLGALPGFHLARPDDPAQVYEGGWRFSPEFGADISEPLEGEPPDSVTFTFWGTDVGLRVRRANFRARLYVTVDGRPANALPRDENGAALILTAADPNQDYLATERVAQNLEPGMHTMEIVAARGWDQWALYGFSVGYRPPNVSYRWAMWGLGLTAVLTLILALYTGKQANWGWIGQKFSQLNDKAQLGLTAVVAAIVALTGWLTWGQQAAGLYRRLGDGGQLALTAAAASIFYVAPSFFIYAAALAVLFILIYWRPAWGAALIAFVIPFYVNHANALTLLAKPILGYRFSPAEIFTLVTAAAIVARSGWRVASSKFDASSGTQDARRITHHASRFTFQAADYAVLAFTLVAALSLFFTDRLDVATNEFRIVIIEPALFYLILRGARLTKREMWVVLDSFVLGGIVVALVGLWQYGFDRNSLITAEGGLMRLRSTYGSPNNVALYLGRILPLLLAMGLMGTENGRRRWLYAAAIAPTGFAVLLTFSKGGLFVGLPAAFLFVFWQWKKENGRKTWPWLIGFGMVGAIALLIAQQIPQLAGRFDLRGATGVFRQNLWRASLNMIADHPWFGVGLDNFLYAYRGRYILESAWQEPNLNHPHNIILDFATRLGLLGLTAGSWMIGQLIRLLRKAKFQVAAEWRPVVIGLSAALINMLAHGIVDHSFFLADLAFAFYLLLGTAVWLAASPSSSRNFPNH